MVWLWSKLRLRRSVRGEDARQERLGLPASRRGSRCSRRWPRSVREAGGRVLLDRPAARLARARATGCAWCPGVAGLLPPRPRPARLRASADEGEDYDAVLATVPNDIFARAARPGPRRRGRPRPTSTGWRPSSTRRRSASCSSSTARSAPSTGRTWATARCPSSGLIEQTNFVEPERYGGRRFLYVANYLPHGHPLLDLDADGAAGRLRAGAAGGQPGLRRGHGSGTPGASSSPPPSPSSPSATRTACRRCARPARGLVLANTTQVYPEDRGTNYAVPARRPGRAGTSWDDRWACASPSPPTSAPAWPTEVVEEIRRRGHEPRPARGARRGRARRTGRGRRRRRRATWPAAAPSRASSAAGRARAPRSRRTRSPGVRAALCADAATADGARRWNDANVLAISLRTMSAAVLGEVLDAWFAGAPSEAADDRANVAHVDAIQRAGA